MSLRKQKPGKKKPRGRPPTAHRRKADRDRLQNERQILSENGFQVMTVVVSAAEAPSLRRQSRLNRLDGLLPDAVKQDDFLEVKRLEHLREIAVLENRRELEIEQEQAQREARDRARWDAKLGQVRAAEAELRANRTVVAASPEPGAPTVDLEKLIRASQSFGIGKYGV